MSIKKKYRLLCLILAGVVLLSLVGLLWYRTDWRFRLWNAIRIYPKPDLAAVELSNLRAVSFDEAQSSESWNELLLLINDAHPLPKDYVPALTEYNGAVMNPAMVEAYVALRDAVQEKTGERIYVSSDFRSTEEQGDLFLEKGDEIAAQAGHSEHEAGLALDVYVKGYGGMSFLKTHYYGGIRKYQWLAMPLALHGVVVKEDGEIIKLAIGEKDSDPVMYITDLLPHLASGDAEKPLAKAFSAENMNILVGSAPLEGEDKEAVKAGVLTYLYENYGIIEEDLQSAELSIVPAAKARDVGFDRSMIGSYGHDDRVCAYPSITALFDSNDSVHTGMCILADKEETGSDGVTGMQCDCVLDLIAEISKALGGNNAVVRASSKCFSSDVTACFDPNFAHVYEKNNASLIGCGITIAKYTGSRGKSGTSDASAEMVAWVRRVLNKAGVVWQSSELGKVDAGGGGTVAKYLAKHNIDTIDIGVGVLSMHAPYEVISKVDLYEGYRAFCAFYRD